MSPESEVLRRLDLIQATLALAFEPQIREAAAAIRSDDVSAAILNACVQWTPSTSVQKTVAKVTSKSERSVRDRLSELVDRRVLEIRGTERKAEFRSTGLV